MKPDSGGSENARVAKAAGIVGLATMLSRILGSVRDIVVASFFGAGIVTDAFFVAFRIPNLLRRLLAEGSLTVSFVPVFTQYLKQKSRTEALELANVAFTALSVLLVIVCLAGVVFAPAIVMVMAPGFQSGTSQYDLTVMLTRFMFPYIFFLSLVALCMGILNSLRHFAAPALSPALLNLSIIVAAFTLRNLFEEPVFALAVGVMVGGALQLAMQWPFLLRLGVRLRPDFSFRHPGLQRIGALMLPAVFGAAIYQINVLIGTVLASLLPKGSVSYLYYADRIVELPLGVFAIAVGTAALPSFAAQVAQGQMDAWKKTISFSLRLILFVSIPATVALIVLRVPIISVLFQHGAFDPASTLKTADALLCYTLGLWAFSTIRIVVSAFYSLQDTKAPMKAAIVALIVNVVCSLLLMGPLEHQGLALATSIASAVNWAMLSVILYRRVGTFVDKAFYGSLGKTLLSSALMGLALFALEALVPWNLTGGFPFRLFHLSASIALGGAVFFLACWLLQSPELVQLASGLKHRLKGNR